MKGTQFLVDSRVGNMHPYETGTWCVDMTAASALDGPSLSWRSRTCLKHVTVRLRLPKFSDRKSVV